jgi:hypothetical protein
MIDFLEKAFYSLMRLMAQLIPATEAHEPARGSCSAAFRGPRRFACFRTKRWPRGR